VANGLNLFRNGAVGFIEWLGLPHLHSRQSLELEWQRVAVEWLG
jgi:hypothetical protein